MKTRKTAAAFAFLMGVGFAVDALAGSAIGPSERQQQEVRRNQNRQAPAVTVAQRDDRPQRQENRGPQGRSENRQENRQENRGQRTENRQAEHPRMQQVQRQDNRQDNRQDFRQERRDDRQDFRQERRDDRGDYRTERRDDRRDYRNDPTPSRPDYRQDRRDDRQDYRADRRDDRRDYARQQQWTRNHNWSSYRRPTYRNDRDWRDYQGARRGYYYAPGYGYYRPPAQYYGHRWNRGQRLPSYYYSYRVYDPYYYDLPAAPYGYEYVYSGSDIILVALTTGIILDVFFDIF
ncbi:RcnB family protein [Asticcacaulis machinosus]|uniref:RcnB family protein n=1 Tax=Asticcacaulis machinosus TaxID=2984211 RepID=A0ABT5HGS4_9CAUL|nr:RcnB family protein [Asticcacaulis machinosus]MDC7675464.1 RcnB family protein [Asticcacaulis machinosus]